ncbi:hypothetical protein TRAPUB_13220 [Trametes pubescens]|uniref:Uncharacterized protein n=1 Tax=Trametes pubescens TaxID=154538 RepID=A0A1M2VRR4_TRAPU|nr:hypothetical protein TRAPUB_13220 [Trametes pubescens]
MCGMHQDSVLIAAEDPEYDAYKRGAFLEKTNRFNKDKPSDVPGPGAYDTDSTNAQNKPPATKPPVGTDRLQALQRKLEDLERIHVEEKKAHHLEQERLKLELNRAQRAAAEQTERADKLKKQNDALDARVQELKKASTTEQSELRELRLKLRASEHERTQLASKHNDAGEIRKALQAAEVRRKEDLRERDRKIAEMEKTLSAERKKRETAEARWQEAKGKTDGRVDEAQAAARDLEARLQEAQKEAQAARQALEDLEATSEDTEEELLAQLEQHRTMLARVAAEYGRLASASVALSVHQQAKRDTAALQLRSNRLERKLANSEGQVVELANLIRQVKDENAFLSAQLREARVEVDAYRHALAHAAGTSAAPDSLLDIASGLETVSRERNALQAETHQAVLANVELWGAFSHSQRDSLLFHASVLNKGLDDICAELTKRTTELSASEATQALLSESLQRAQAECAEAQRMLAENTAELAEAKVQGATFKKELEMAQANARAEVARLEQNLQREKEGSQRLSAAAQKAKQAEQFLRSEVEQLGSDLAEAERYEEAYNALLAEVDALVLRNALAEDEAEALSKHNAELLGHHNPAQRIMYVDRIRRELHDTKQKLLAATRDRDGALADNDELRHELGLYKSVAVPQDVKPRTTITRVGRVPSGLSESEPAATLPRSASGARLASVPEACMVAGDADEAEAVGEGDMTLDEIM